MEKQILSEIRSVKEILAKLAGTTDLPKEEQFSSAALDKAAKQFQKLSIERGEWIEDQNISKYIKNAPYRAGAFIRGEFGFKNFFKRGHTYYYNKQDIIALANELKVRNVDLARYIEYAEDQEKFKKYLESIEKNKEKRKTKAFDLPYDLKDITTSPAKAPHQDIIRQDIAKLREEFMEYKLADYVDVFKNNYAMLKSIYMFEKYLDADIKKRCRRWCDNFNYANEALKLVTNKAVAFNPVKDDDMIQL